MIDAQWVAINAVAMKDLPGEILFWDMSSVTLVIHARHALLGTFPYDVFRGNGQGAENEADEKARAAEREREEHNQQLMDNLTNQLYEGLQEEGFDHSGEGEFDDA